MIKIGIIICARYSLCGGGKCFRSMQEHTGGFAKYSMDEKLELVGYTNCGGCPGGNVEYAPQEMLKNGVDVIHLATGMVVGYPPCPHLGKFKEFIASYYNIPVEIGTHPIPMKYFNAHKKLSFWQNAKMGEIAGHLLSESPAIMEQYN